MKCWIVWTLSLSILLIGSFATGDEKKSEPPKHPYAELFSLPAKIKLDDKQKQKLAELRRVYEPSLAFWDKGIAARMKRRDTDSAGVMRRARDKQARLVVRKKNAILTDEQRADLGIRWIPSFAQEKALKDKKVWDLSQLEKVFTIQSRSFDPEEQVISFNVITKRKWTQKERQTDAENWVGGEKFDDPLVKIIFYNKHEETSFVLNGGRWQRARGRPVSMPGGITKVPIKLTDKQAEEGLLRFRIRIDLDESPAMGLESSGRGVATVKFVYPEPK